MTMKLYSWDISPYAARVRMQIYAKGLTDIATEQTPFYLTQKFYEDRLANRKQAEMQVAAVQEQQGETMSVLNPAELPDSPSFPNRIMFAGGGFAGGLMLGLGLAIWLEMRDTSLRTENDVVAVLDLPVLSQVPWVGVDEEEKDKKNGKRKSKIGAKAKAENQETVEV